MSENIQNFKDLIAAAEKGDADSQYEAAVLLEKGEGVEKNFDKSAELCLKAAEQGNVNAQWNVGSKLDGLFRAAGNDEVRMLQQSYKKAVGNPDNDELWKKAMHWLTKAADNGSLEACVKLGFIYTVDCEEPQDLAKAKAYLTKAAEQGHAGGQYMLGEFYENQENNIETAMVWYKKAADQGLEDAIERLK